MIPYGMHEGNRSEYLGGFALSTIGFAIPILRQSDHFSVDFLVHLAKRLRGTNKKGNSTDNIVATGRAFQIQIKSDDKPVVIEGVEAVEAVLRSRIPFFLGIVSKSYGRIRIYPTTTRLCFYRTDEQKPIKTLTLFPGGPDETMVTPKPGKAEIHVGKPIAEFDLDDLEASPEKSSKRDIFLK